jgi:hypothetical protein
LEIPIFNFRNNYRSIFAMKKTLVTLLVLTFAVFAFACGGEAPNANANKTNANANKPATPAPTVATTPVNANVPPVNGANGNKTAPITQGQNAGDKMKAKEDAVKTAPAPPAAAPTKKP